MRSTTAGNCCPQQQSRWLSDPSHTLAAASETPANCCSRPHDTPGMPGREGFRLGKKWRACSEAAQTENGCRNVALYGTLATPRQTHAHQKSPDPPFLFMPPWDLQRIKDAVITRIKCQCLIEQRALTALRMILQFPHSVQHIRSYQTHAGQTLNTALHSPITAIINAIRVSRKTFSQYSLYAWTSIFSDNKTTLPWWLFMFPYAVFHGRCLNLIKNRE